jgi:group I intron endonuclease
LRPCIYKIKNKVNGKFYIGSTLDYKDRWRDHINALRKQKHHSIHLQRAWNKYGEDNFEFEVIEFLDGVSNEELREREKYYLSTLKPYKREIGYNVSRGTTTCVLYGKDNGFYGKKHTGEATRKISEALKEYYRRYGHVCVGRKVSKETKMKISRANKGRKLSEEARKKLSIIHKGRKPWNYGKELPESVKEKLSEKNKGELNNNSVITRETARRIKMALYCDMDIKEIAKALWVSTHVVYNIKNLKTWDFVNSELNEYIKNREEEYKEAKRKRAIELYKEGYSTNQIAKMLNMSRNSIRKCLKENNIEIIQIRNQYLYANTEVTGYTTPHRRA